MNIITQIHTAFTSYLRTTFGHTDSYLFTLNVDEKRQGFGDISTNAALLLAKQLKRKPIDIAHEIAKGFSHPWVANIEAAGPGFLNLYFTPLTLQSLATAILQQGITFFKPDDADFKGKICIEFVSANPTGPLHFGHGRGGIIGDVLANILKFVGYQVTKEFYINDAGSQIQKLGDSLKIRYQQACGMQADLPEDAYHGVY